MSNQWFTPGSVPVTQSRGSSSTLRAEFASLEAAFDKLPTPAQTWGASANYATAGGSVDAWTASISATYLTAYTDGMSLRVKFAAPNTSTTPTLNLNGLGTKQIVSEAGGPLAAGDIAAGSVVTLIYNSTFGKFQIFLGSSVASAAANAASAVASAAAAATSASAAATSATAAAGSATSAATSATAAATSATAAATAKTNAESYAALAATGAKFYDTIALGRAAVADTFTFGVKAGGSDGLTRPTVYRRDSAGTQTLLYAVVSGSYLDIELKAAKLGPLEELGPVNIFNKAAATDSFVLADGSSTPTALAGYFVTDFMQVVAGSYITSNQSGVAGYGLHFYDASQTLLSSPGPITANTPYAVPSTAAYVRATFQIGTTNGRLNSTKHDLVVVQGQTLPSYYLPFGRPGAYTLWRETHVALYDWPLRNLHNSATTFVDYTFDANGAPTASAGSFVTELIPVIPGETYTVYANGAGTLNGHTYFFDIDKSVMYRQDGAFMTGLTQITVPASCFWMRLGYLTSANRVANLQVYHGTTTPGGISAITPAMRSNISGEWFGKQALVQGDSISDPASGIGIDWLVQVGAYHGFSVTNCALGGRVMLNALKKHDGSSMASGDFTNIDLTVLALGINDYLAGTAVGSISDSTATASFYGQTKNFVETVLGWKPAQRMVICTPMRTSTADPINYVTALRAVGALYGIPVLDLYAISSLSSLTTPTWTSDGIHPNTAGFTACLINPGIGFFKTCLPVT
jgi:hypothetical protein